MEPLLYTLKAFVLAVVREAVGPAVRDALADVLPAVVRRASLPPYLTKAELSELTGWSERKVDYLRERRLLPYTKVGRSVLFETADVEALLDEGRVEVRSRELLGGRGN